MYWDWDPSLETGIDAIDDQHRRIVGYINDMHDNIERRNRAVLIGIIDNMITYTLTHFAFEEGLMARASYPALAEHKLVHESFAKRMRYHKKQFHAGKDVTRQVMGDLQVWLISHIKEDDRDYGPLVREMLAREAVPEKSWVKKTVERMFC
ncbi:MAG TPA: bacteriohemerythrin [Acidiferrobacter sp.]|nr:bacteriohemerythrin [Acidiferrobacter sp.]